MSKIKRLKTFLKKKDYVSIKLKMLKSGHFSLKGTINGVKATFILDTGASATVLDTNQAKQFKVENMQESEDPAAGLGGISMDKFEVEDIEVTLGDFKIPSMQLFLVDLSHVNSAFKNNKMRPVNGIVGADILKGYNAVIDYETNKLYLVDKKED